MTNHRFFHCINQQNNQREYSQTKTNETGGMEEEIESGTDLDEFDDESSYERRQTVTMTRTIKAGSERLIKNSGNDLAKDPNDFAMIPETNRDRSRKNINYFSFIKKSALNKGSFEINGRHNEFVSCMDDVFYVKNLRFPDCVVRNLCQTYNTPQDGQYYDSVYEKIHVELNNFYSFIKPLKEDEIIRKATFYCIADSIKKLKFVKQVKYYGSYSSKTYLPVSDIDLVCYCNPIFDEISLLFNIAKQLSYDGIIESKFNIVPMSKIPLLKFHDSLTCLPINITINTPNVMERSQYLREHIKTNSNQMKILLFLKYYLLSKGTNQVFYGGIGSYSLALMVIRFFQEESVKELIKNENVFQNSILGYLLMGFLERFGDVNFFKHHIISVQDNGDYIRCSYQDYNRHSNPDKKTSVLRIKDHIEPWNDVSYGSFNSGEILKDFQFLHDKFMKGDKSKTKSLLGQVLYVVDSFVEYRNLLLFLFRKWFDDYDVKEYMAGKYPTKLKFQEFIEKRKIFRKINIGFSNYYLEDKSIEYLSGKKSLKVYSHYHRIEY
ncbi:hypothetical protein NH340_JMT03260 [Sarcoptes scabiei]|nr:hypothetical protein NH340_JMT03260 [Sarcoptes scabiei]